MSENQLSVKIKLQAKQGKALCSPATEILYGGAVYGGKGNVLTNYTNMLKVGMKYTDKKDRKVFDDTFAGKVLTPFGFKLIDDIKVGDQVCNPDGSVARVIATKLNGAIPCYKITFIDGNSIVVDEDHMWPIWQGGERRFRKAPPTEIGSAQASKENWNAFLNSRCRTITTKDLHILMEKERDIENRGGVACWPITPICRPCNMTLPSGRTDVCPPYTLGVLLGDGSLSQDKTPSWTKPDHEISEHVQQELIEWEIEDQVVTRDREIGEYSIVGTRIRNKLRSCGVAGCLSEEKFVPNYYKHAPEPIRRSILNGLMDTDAWADSGSNAEFSSVSRQLADDVRHLASSLGYCASLSLKPEPTYEYNGEKRIGQPSWRVYIKGGDAENLFRLKRKKEKLYSIGETRSEPGRRIIDIHPVEAFETKCIQVDHPNSLYITNGFIVTHNSYLLRAASIYFSCEIPGLQTYLFRRKYDDLVGNHLEGPQGYPVMLDGLIRAKRCQISRGDMTIRFVNGSRIYMRHMQHENNRLDYAGREIHLLCCEENEKIKLADGTLKRIRDVQVGDLALTLQGPRKISYVGPRRFDDCVSVTVSGKSQIQSITHKVLTPKGWISYDDMSCVFHPSYFFSSKEFCTFCKSSLLLKRRYPSFLQFPDNRNHLFRQIHEPFQSQLDRQLLSESAFCMDRIVRETCFESFDSSIPVSLPSSSVLRFPVVLHEPFPQKEVFASEVSFLDGECSYAQNDYSNEDFLSRYSSSLCRGDEYQYHELGNNRDFFRRLIYAEQQSQTDLREDEMGIAQKDTRRTLRYAHPYTGELRQAKEGHEIGFCEMVPCGKKWVIDLTVAGENHYITENGLVNKNCFDELTHFPESVYRYLRGRCRMGGMTVPKKYEGLFPRIISGANPGGISHGAVKKAFISGGEWVLRKMHKSEGGMLRQFIPAKMEDNPIGMRNDPTYADKMEGLGDKALVESLKNGDWDVVTGAMYGNVWKKEIHVCKPFSIPSSWKIWRGADDGFGAPACVHWAAEDPINKTVYIIKELYKAGMLPEEFAEKTLAGDASIMVHDYVPVNGRMVATEPRMLNKRLEGYIDNSAFGNDGSSTISRGNQLNDLGCNWQPVPKWPGSRIAGVQEIHRRLAVNKLDSKKRPGLIVFDCCHWLIKLMPEIPRDPDNIEDVDEKYEDDHSYSSLRYSLQWHFPFVKIDKYLTN